MEKYDILKVILIASQLTAAFKCGRNSYLLTKVVGGNEVSEHEFPWQAVIKWRVGMTKGGHVCGGSLISFNYVVTAAHCFAHGDNPSYYSIVLGAHNSAAPEGSEQEIGIKRIIIHPRYSTPVTYDNDIALIELQHPALVTNHVQFICLPTFIEFELPSKMCTVTGWGGTLADKDIPSMTLQKAEVPLVDFKTCNDIKSYNGRLTRNMFCAGYADGRADACQGDSGGPLQCKSAISGGWMLQGITSFGDGCGEANKYGVYTVVRHYLDWIHKESMGEIKIPSPPLPPKPEGIPPPIPPKTKEIRPPPPPAQRK